MRRRVRRVQWIGGLLLLWTSQASAQVPHLIRYQGQAVDSRGVPLEGPYTLTFRLYDAESAGTIVWQEQQANVPLNEGHFSVLLETPEAFRIVSPNRSPGLRLFAFLTSLHLP